MKYIHKYVVKMDYIDGAPNSNFLIRPDFLYACATTSELPSTISSMAHTRNIDFYIFR